MTDPITEDEIERCADAMLSAHRGFKGNEPFDFLITERHDAIVLARICLRTALSLRSGDGRPAKARGKEGWRPIETAPRGEPILYGHYDLGRLVWAVSGIRKPNGVHWHDADHSDAFRVEPTHWQPLPAPPGLPREPSASGTSDRLTGWNEAREAAAQVAFRLYRGWQRNGGDKLSLYSENVEDAIRALELSTGKEGRE